jgi:AraC family transcriptional regulator of arabinose operon
MLIMPASNISAAALAPLEWLSPGGHRVETERLLESISDPRLARVLEAIAADPRLDVNTLARLVNLSPSRLQHLFKEHLAIRIRDFIGQQRLQRAVWLLWSTDMAIKEITFEVGYRHPSSFVRAFRRHLVKTPESYRRDLSRIC